MNKLFEKYKNIPLKAKATFWFLICVFFQKGISFLTTPLFTRILDTEEYGKYNVFNSWLGVITVFVTLNLYLGSYSSGLVKNIKDKDKYSSSLQGLTLTLVLSWGVIYFIFNEFFNSLFGLSTLQMVFMFSIMWTTSIFSFWATEQRVLYKYKSLVAVVILSSILKPVVSFLLCLVSDDKVNARILGIVVVELAFFSFCFVSQMVRGKKFFDKNTWLNALKMNIPLIPHYLSSTILNSSDKIMIDKMVGSGEVGIYSVAYSLSMIMTVFNMALIQALEPWMYECIRDKKIYMIKKIAIPCLLFVAFINLVMIGLAPDILPLFAPKEYMNAIYIIPPVAMSVFFMFSYNLFAVFEFFYKKTFFISFASTFGAVLNVVLNLVFIKLFGYVAAGYTTLVCFALYALMHYLFMNSICKRELHERNPYNIFFYLLMSLIFLIYGFVLMISYDFLILRLVLLVIVFVVPFFFMKRLKQLIGLVLGRKKLDH